MDMIPKVKSVKVTAQIGTGIIQNKLCGTSRTTSPMTTSPAKSLPLPAVARRCTDG